MTAPAPQSQPEAAPVRQEKNSNYEVALKAEMKRVTRCFHKHSSEARADMAASHRLGYQQRQSLGDFFYVHPSFPNTAFKTRSAAARRALAMPLEQSGSGK